MPHHYKGLILCAGLSEVREHTTAPGMDLWHVAEFIVFPLQKQCYRILDFEWTVSQQWALHVLAAVQK